eukprot:Nitzschia sp. Nitz4//scaffold165_size50357//36794//38089//NITZ4_007024-RA/size50357-processed-gene-0.58-mRNA-1//-1//CDS//3329538141//1619//frame0
MCRMKRNGLEFTNYFTNACMCSPSRSVLVTSQFPVQTGVTTTGSPEPKFSLPTDIPNLATVLQTKGYHMEWHGKWHLGGHPSDYGFSGWVPPDAGNYLSINESLGGGEPDNDGRFLQEICDFLKNHDQAQPFCLVASFVNPHDVYVAQHEPALGYTREDFNKVRVPLPSNWTEDTDDNNKPRAQSMLSMARVPFENKPQDYVNFYAHLHTVVDRQIGVVLDHLDACGLTDQTVIIRTADHGEQALSHSLVEKFFNVYEESIHIPMIVSNPLVFPEPQTTEIPASHVDLLPTLVSLLDIDQGKNGLFVGRDLTPVLDQQTAIPPSFKLGIHFTYDDIPSHGGPSVIRCIRTSRFKYAVYFTPDGKDADWELYDLQRDPLENMNRAGEVSFGTLQQRLEEQLLTHMKASKTLPMTFQWPPKATRRSIGGPPIV